MQRPLITLGLAAALTAPAFAADTYTVDPKHTFPNFEVNHLGYSLQRGRFDRTSGTLVLDRAARTGSVNITIDAASVDTGLEELEKHLKGEEFFNTAKFPSITFKSTRFFFTGDRLTGVEGDFTLLGVTKTVGLSVDLFKCAPNPMLKKEVCGANATGSIKRSDFGMTKYVPFVSDEVKITLSIEAIKD